jgi:AraC-like DNA-binding protein
METVFYVRNMVCDRCIKVLQDELSEQRLRVKSIELGKVTLLSTDREFTASLLEPVLEKNGFSLIKTPDLKLVELVKVEIIKLFQDLPLHLKVNLSDYLAGKVEKDYSVISKIFSYTESTTIEKYFIRMKIEKVKELIQAGGLNFTEISQLLDYSNVNHLSTQFKAETGLSMSEYKSMEDKIRNSLDQIL